MQGRWERGKHGDQYAVSQFEEVIQPTEAGIIAYLSSGYIKGIGEKTARRIYEQFGDKALDILDREPKRLLEVRGKYGVDYALKKDATVSPPKYLVFFKARDADALTAAFTEYSAKKVRNAQRPSVLVALSKFKALIKNAVVDRTKRKELER